MNISSSYPAISSYSTSTSSKAGAARPAARELSLLGTDRPVDQISDVRDSAARRQNKFSLSVAAAQADQVRGKLAANDSPNASTQRALNAYQSIEVQQQRDELIQALGVDVYV